MNPVLRRLWALLVGVGWFVAVVARAQTAAPPLGINTTNPLAVGLTLWPPERDASFSAHDTIELMAQITLDAPASAGDLVRVDFFANARKLGSRKSVWHAGFGPDPHSHHAQPMIMRRAGFDPVLLDWSNVPAGKYALTAKATGAGGRSAVSEAVKVTVGPAAAP
jgi:hypothetical protein